MADKSKGYVKDYRSSLEWEWFTEPLTAHFFRYCVLKANRKEGKGYKGTNIPVGSFVSSYEQMAKETGLTLQQLRTAIKRLKSTYEITYKSTRHGTLVNVVKWAYFQGDDDESNIQINIQTNTPSTRHQHTTNNQQEIKNIRSKEIKNIYSSNLLLSLVPDSIRKEFSSFLEMREENKKSLKTKKQVELQLENLRKISNDPEQQKKIITQSVEKGWLSFYPLREEKTEYRDLPPVYDSSKNPDIEIISMEELSDFFR